MTGNELQQLVDYISNNAKLGYREDYDAVNGVYVSVPYVDLIDLTTLLGNYLVEESEKTCQPNYEAMYNDMATKMESQNAYIEELKHKARILEERLVCARGAIAMVEVIYGRQWKPSNLELIR